MVIDRRRLATFTLILLILAFTLYFSWYTIQRYETLHAYTADLSLIDQAMWNTLHGRFLEATWGERQQPRLAEHFEPVLIPLATIFWLWDDVRALLIWQSFALAMGALPICWLARDILSRAGLTNPILHLLFPLIYLLSPPLQAAAVADFHADPLAVAPFLFAFWYATQKRWPWMWFWAVVVMMTKETMPTLVVMLGGYLLVDSWLKKKSATTPVIAAGGRRSAVVQGLGLMVAGSLWFIGATFGLVAPLARDYFGSQGPVYLANRFSANPLDWPRLLQDPARLRYLGGLIISTGGLALLAPHYLLLGLPIFIANTFSNFAGQYSGEQHYSAPLVAILIIAAIHGTKNLTHLIAHLTPHAPHLTPHVSRFTFHVSRFTFHALIFIALTITLLYHTRYGWTPLSRRAEVYASTPHTQILPVLLAQIPAGVPVSASAAIHPHLAHRPVAYTFPTVQEAEFILVDVTDIPGVHPNDVKSRLEALLSSGDWRLLAAIDGFILLQQTSGAGPQTLPDQFYTFARADEPEARPQVQLDLTFDEQIRLLGFDVLDKPFHRQTSVRLYWQALRPDLAADLLLWPQFFDDFGQPLTDPRQQPAIAALWYPPSRWQPGEIVVTETLPQNLGEHFHLAAGISRGPDFTDPNQRLPVSGAVAPHDQRTWAQVASFERSGWALNILPPQATFQPLQTVDISFKHGLRLRGLQMPAEARGDQALPILLAWEPATSLPLDYTIFLHLLDAGGDIVTQNDAQPFWLTPLPTSRWQPGQTVLDAHRLLPPLPAGRYQLRLGLYDWRTLERLPLLSGADSVILGEVQIDD